MNTWKLDSITLKTAREQNFEVAILPLGATEPHNYHLPYGTDTFQVQHVAERACETATRAGARVVLLPAVPYAVQSNMMEFPFAMNVYPSTMFALLKDIVDSLEKHGIRKLILLNGHGGNDFVKPFAREMMGRTSVFLCVINWWDAPGKEALQNSFVPDGDHANDMETSAMLSLAPDLVHMEDAADGAWKKSRFTGVREGWVSISRPWHLLTQSSGVGTPLEATAEKGAAYMQLVVERLSGFIKELSDAEIDATFPFEVEK